MTNKDIRNDATDAFEKLFELWNNNPEGTIEARIFSGGKGNFNWFTCKNVYPEDAKFINENTLVVSVEDCGFSMVVYLSDKEDVDTEKELCEIALDRSCQEVIAQLVKHYKENKECEIVGNIHENEELLRNT